MKNRLIEILGSDVAEVAREEALRPRGLLQHLQESQPLGQALSQLEVYR